MKHIFSGLAILAISISSYAQSAPTIPAILAEIESNNRQLQISAANNEAEVLAAKADNTLGATSLEYSPFFSGGTSGLASSELIVKQSFDFPTLYSSRNKLADASRVALDQILRVDARTLRMEATRACLEYIGAQKQNEILRQRIAVTDTIMQLYDRKLKAGTATRLEANRIQLSLQDLNREILANDLAAAEAESRLTLLNGGKYVNLTGLDYDPDMLTRTPIASVILNSHDLNNLSRSDYGAIVDYVETLPEIKASESAIEYASQELSLARSSWLPEVSLGYRRNTDGHDSVNGFLVGLDFSFFSNGRKSKAAKAKKTVAELQRQSEISQLVAEITTTLSRLQLLRKSIDATDTHLIEETLTLYRRSLQLGQITLTDYYQETDLLYTRLAERASLINTYNLLLATLIP